MNNMKHDMLPSYSPAVFGGQDICVGEKAHDMVLMWTGRIKMEDSSLMAEIINGKVSERRSMRI